MARSFTDWLQSQKQTKRFHPTWILLVVVATLIIAGIVWLPAFLVSKNEGHDSQVTQSGSKVPAGDPKNGAVTQANGEPKAPNSPDGTANAQHFTPPDPDSIPAGEFGDMVRLGRNIFNDTQTYAKAYVGNGLNCVNCHLDSGRKPDSAPLWASYGMFPAYRDKNKKVNTYEDRLMGCFRFSMNGKAPPAGSEELAALTSYSFWLAKGAPIGVELEGRGYRKPEEPAQSPDEMRGKTVFEANCVICHGANGEGTKVGGRYVFPPLWGKDSFNSGAGMTKIHNAAAFIHANMPLGQGNSLSPQEAWDVAKYMNSHERPPDPRKK